MAHLTFIGPLACVCSHVAFERTMFREPSGTHLAGERPLPGVSAQMCLERATHTEPAMANRALERTFARVDSEVDLQGLFGNKLLAAISARKSLSALLL